jgi:hypothetical protein
LPPTPVAEVGPFVSFALGGIPGGGYLLVWQDPLTFVVMAQRISAAGFPVPPAKSVATLDDSVLVQTVAVTASGAWLVLWTQPAGADQVGVGGALFDAQDHLQRLFLIADPLPDPGGRVISSAPHAAVLPGGGFAVAFEVGIQEDPAGDPLRPSDSDVYAVRLDAGANPVGQPVRVNEETIGFQHPTGLGASATGLVVSWDSNDGNAGALEIHVRVLGFDLAPASEEIRVDEGATAAALRFGSRLAVGADGRFVVVWEEVEGAASRVRIRAFGPAGQPLGGESTASPAEVALAGAPDVAITEEGVVWASWVAREAPAGPDPPEIAIQLRPFDLNGRPIGAALAIIVSAVGEGPLLTGGRAGALVAWKTASESPLLLGCLVGLAAGTGTPPADLALESPQLPGFRVWVRIASRPDVVRWGTRVEPCVGEAVCAAGALPDRAEAIVRVVGPRPNGFLWPILVKLSTSQVEVWVEQKKTGRVRYYLLPATGPGSEDLPGVIDRDGFRP